jgi:hypothetical protein
MNAVLHSAVAVQITAWEAAEEMKVRFASRDVNERGEGVISAAIAVMIMAVLGAIMFAVYSELVTTSTDKAKAAVDGMK